MVQSKINLKASLKHLRRDRELSIVIKKHKLSNDIWSRRPVNEFESLVRSIIYQQISGKAAESIFKKFVGLFDGKFPKPSQVLKTKTATLRSAGLSPQKLRYIIDLSEKFEDGTVSSKNFSRMEDEEIIEHLTQVKGIGVWTAHMFLMFTLKRPDILPTGDLGIQKGFQKLFKLRTLPNPKKMETLAKPWEGHRTIACLYLWRLVDGE